MSDVKTWVSDQLHDVLGFSDKYTTEYLMSLAKNATSCGNFLEKISESFSVDQRMSTFASELWDKVPHKEDRSIAYRARERALIEEQQRNASYKLVSDDDEDDITQNQGKGSKKDKRRKHLRHKEVQESSSSEDEQPKKKVRDESDSDEWEKAEAEAARDRDERDEFAARLKKKDKERQRNVMERSDAKVSELQY